VTVEEDSCRTAWTREVRAAGRVGADQFLRDGSGSNRFRRARVLWPALLHGVETPVALFGHPPDRPRGSGHCA